MVEEPGLQFSLCLFVGVPNGTTVGRFKSNCRPTASASLKPDFSLSLTSRSMGGIDRCDLCDFPGPTALREPQSTVQRLAF